MAGKYRVERVLGVGGMGVVLAATHLELDEPVAIKVLRQFVAGSPDVVRFQREARVVAKLRSEHAVRVRDVGRLEDGSPFMVMELLEGETLKERVARLGPFPPAQAVDLFLQVCDAVAEAHQNGVVHRDIKPTNVFVTTRRGEPVLKVIDFGVSKVLSRPETSGDDPWLTTTENMLGSPHFMPPEQMLSSRDVDARADIWALGVTLFFMLTGELPFAGPSVREVMTAVITAPARRADALVPSLRREVADVIARCVEKEPAARFPSVAELAAELRRLRAAADDVPVAPAPVTPARGDPLRGTLDEPALDVSLGATIEGRASAAREERLPRRLLGVGLVLAVVVLCVGMIARARHASQSVLEPQQGARSTKEVAPPAEPLPAPPAATADAPPPAASESPPAPAAAASSAAGASTGVAPAASTPRRRLKPPPKIAASAPAPAAPQPDSVPRDPSRYR